MVVSIHLFILIIVFGIVFLMLLRRDKKMAYVRRSYKLPPGSMGWPYIGETLKLYSQNPNVFFTTKQLRHGEIFKTHILGCRCVMLASPEAARFVLVTHSHLFKPTYPKSKENLIGPSALFFHQGNYHIRLRKIIQCALSPKSVRNLVSSVEGIAVNLVDSWAGGHLIDTFQEMKKFSFEVGILAIFGELEAHYREELRKNYSILQRGYNSFPTKFPGTPYQKALSARKRLSKILSEIISKKKEKKCNENNLLGALLASKLDDDDDNKEGLLLLSEDQIGDNIIGVLFAAQDTTASAITWILKYLHDCPKLLQAVKAEQETIYQSNKEGNYPLTWTQTRNMPITYKVILESLRMASIISFTYREAVADVEYKGYLIPKGWKVMPLFRNIHHNQDFFSNPFKFDPSRFEITPPKPYTFMPFGSGVHSCPGNELAKLEMFIIIHHLVTKFRWEVKGSQGGIQYCPFPVPLHGLPSRFWRESTS